MGLTRDEMAEILRAVRRDMRRPETRPRPYRPTASTTLGIYIGKTGGGGINARTTSNVPGSGTVTLYQFTTSGLSSTNQTETAWNISRSAVAGDAFVQLKQEMLSGKFVVDFEDCTT